MEAASIPNVGYKPTSLEKEAYLAVQTLLEYWDETYFAKKPTPIVTPAPATPSTKSSTIDVKAESVHEVGEGDKKDGEGEGATDAEGGEDVPDAKDQEGVQDVENVAEEYVPPEPDLDDDGAMSELEPDVDEEDGEKKEGEDQDGVDGTVSPPELDMDEDTSDGDAGARPAEDADPEEKESRPLSAKSVESLK
ncbi:hypothetical protein HK097_001469, partial [Rhizophlyctis rosea]